MLFLCLFGCALCLAESLAAVSFNSSAENLQAKFELGLGS